MLSCFGNYEIQKANATRVDSTRLQSRVGNENNLLRDKEVLIIGCGAIGSRIALNLALNGIENISLMDHDCFSIENITRHICDINYVGWNKAKAVERHLKIRVPHINVIPYETDAMETMNSTPDILKNNHIVISATGDKTFNLMLNESRISPATLYSWTELFGYASHAILTLTNSGGCLNCKLDQKLKFKFECIVSPPEELLRHEIGCGSVYLPFSSIDSNTAADYASRLALSYLRGLITKSTIWTFYGDLNEAVRQGLDLSAPPENNFKLVKSIMSRKLGCRICKELE
ncbi:MAG: ThiF family adenylyltransferase [Deltaproteobacteria bacterium]